MFRVCCHDFRILYFYFIFFLCTVLYVLTMDIVLNKRDDDDDDDDDDDYYYYYYYCEEATHSSGVASNCGPPQTSVRGPPALPLASGGAKVSGARSIDYFGTLLLSPPLPLEVWPWK